MTHVEEIQGNYFVAAYPPFSVWNDDGAIAWQAAVASPPRDVPLVVYAHIPFCARRCDFCYYLSYADKSRAEIDRYLGAMLREAEHYAAAPAFRGRNAEVVYIGGGTPSMLSDRELERLLGGLTSAFGTASIREFTVEVAPQTTRAESLAVMKAHGVTRLSMGVQQMNDAVLEASGRIHRVADVERAWSEITATGFATTNLDLIAGLPGETDATFFAGLDRVIDMTPDTVTIYALEVPRNTPLARALRSGEAPARVADWPTKRDRLRRAFERLEDAGFGRTTAYAAARDPDQHRFLYMVEQYAGADVIGLGSGSFGYVNGICGQTAGHYDAYVAATEAGAMRVARGYALSGDERYTREFVLSLKLGLVDRAALEERHGRDVLPHMGAALESFEASGWLEVGADRIKVTAEGLLFVDEMIPKLVMPAHQGATYW